LKAGDPEAPPRDAINVGENGALDGGGVFERCKGMCRALGGALSSLIL